MTAKLKYRLENPAEKKNWIADDDDYEFYLTVYRPNEYHEISVSYDYDANANENGHFEVFVDDMPWLGSDEEKERLGRKVWMDCGELDLHNDQPETVALPFNSDQELLEYGGLRHGRSH